MQTIRILIAGAIFLFLIAAVVIGLFVFLRPGQSSRSSSKTTGKNTATTTPKPRTSTVAMTTTTTTAKSTKTTTAKPTTTMATTKTTTTAKTTTKTTAKPTTTRITTTTTTTTPKTTTRTTAKPTTTTRITTTTTTTAKTTTRTTAKPTTTTKITTTTTPLPWTLPIKTILCTFGTHLKTSAARPKEGLCDIIFWDFFYDSGRGTFLNRSSVGLQWFLGFARNDSGTTQFGIGIDHSNALGAYDDLNKAAGISTFTDFWKMNIRHYGLLKFQVHDNLTNRSTIQDYNNLLKRLRGLQEVNRAGDVKKFGYIILGVDLFAANTDKVHDHLNELLRGSYRKEEVAFRGYAIFPTKY